MFQQAPSILSFNFLGIPFFSKNYQKRLKVLVEEVAKINPDILCFQEIWLGLTRNYLRKTLKPLGFEYSFHPTSKFRANGLLTLSKKKILSAKSQDFKPLFTGLNFSFFELLGAKSYCLTKIKLADKKEIFLFNIHLSADWRNKENSISHYAPSKLVEIEILSKAINFLEKEKIIVVGDFNFEENSFLYKKLLEASGLKDALLKKGLWLKTVLPNLYKFYVPKWGRKIDFAFTKNLPKNSVLDFKVLWGKPFKDIGYLSDHAGILVKLKI